MGRMLNPKLFLKLEMIQAWKGLYFGGTAFKKQRIIPKEKYGDAARYATQFMDVVTTLELLEQRQISQKLNF